MSDREDVEALAEVIHTQVLEDTGPPDWQDALFARRILASSWLAVHDELVRAVERERLAGEFEKFAALLTIPQSRDAFLAAAGNLRWPTEARQSADA